MKQWYAIVCLSLSLSVYLSHTKHLLSHPSEITAVYICHDKDVLVSHPYQITTVYLHRDTDMLLSHLYKIATALISLTRGQTFEQETRGISMTPYINLIVNQRIYSTTILFRYRGLFYEQKLGLSHMYDGSQIKKTFTFKCLHFLIDVRVWNYTHCICA